jgi:outer membrane protein TolC
MQRDPPPRAPSSSAGRRLGAPNACGAPPPARREAAQLARLRFDWGGVTDSLIVLDAEREVLNNLNQLAQAQTDTATALVSVYRALGGGWAAPDAQ